MKYDEHRKSSSSWNQIWCFSKLVWSGDFTHLQCCFPSHGPGFGLVWFQINLSFDFTHLQWRFCPLLLLMVSFPGSQLRLTYSAFVRFHKFTLNLSNEKPRRRGFRNWVELDSSSAEVLSPRCPSPGPHDLRLTYSAFPKGKPRGGFKIESAMAGRKGGETVQDSTSHAASLICLTEWEAPGSWATLTFTLPAVACSPRHCIHSATTPCKSLFRWCIGTGSFAFCKTL